MALAGRIGVGAAWGIGAAGLIAGHLRSDEPALMFALGAAVGAELALLRPRHEAWRHAALAAAAAAAGALLPRLPEPTFQILVPLMAAAAFWPFRLTREEPPARGRPGWTLWATFALGAGVFFLQSANRFWGFGAGCKDLGLFYQTHWLIAHGLPPVNTVMGMHALADHAELLDYVVAPLLRVYEGPETLLLVQALAVASAVFPLAWLGRRLLGDGAGLTLAWLWLLNPDVHMGVMFDYNPTQLGAAGLLWTAWALVERGAGCALLAALVSCLSREDLPLYVAMLALVLALRAPSRRRCLAVALLAAAVFLVDMAVVFPRFREGGFRHWEFEQLGETPAATGVSVLRRPDRALALLADNPQKRRALLLPLVSTGYLGLADPLALWMQVPNWAARFLSTHATRWWGYYYGVPAAATALVGVLLGWRRLRAAGRDGRRLPGYLLACAALASLLPPYRTPGGNRRSDLYYLRQRYLEAPADVTTNRAAVAFVGSDPALQVAAQDRLLPWLAGRRRIVMLEQAQDAEVIVLQLNGSKWPDGTAEWRRIVSEIANGGGYGIAFCSGQSVVLRRGGSSVPCAAWDAIQQDIARRGIDVPDRRTSD